MNPVDVTIDARLPEIARAQPYPLLFATVSGAHLYGFPSPVSAGVETTFGVSALDAFGNYHPSYLVSDPDLVHEVRDQFVNVIKEALSLLDCKSCGDDSSCIACLRTYFNQRDHNRLRRGWARSYLGALM